MVLDHEVQQLAALALGGQARDVGLGLLDPAWRDRRAVTGTWLARSEWGTRANAESKALLAALAFERLGFERLTAFASTRNERSQAALERLGFVREGTLRAWHRHGDDVHDSVVYGLLRADWEGSPLRGVAVRIEGDADDTWHVASRQPRR